MNQGGEWVGVRHLRRLQIVGWLFLHYPYLIADLIPFLVTLPLRTSHVHSQRGTHRALFMCLVWNMKRVQVINHEDFTRHAAWAEADFSLAVLTR